MSSAWQSAVFDAVERLVFIGSTAFLPIFHLEIQNSADSSDVIGGLPDLRQRQYSILLLNAGYAELFPVAHGRYQARLIWIVPALARANRGLDRISCVTFYGGKGSKMNGLAPQRPSPRQTEFQACRRCFTAVL